MAATQTNPQTSPLATLEEGLTFHTVDELKKLLQLLPTKKNPTRKAELVAAIASYLRSPSLGKAVERARYPSASRCRRSRLRDQRPLSTGAIPGQIKLQLTNDESWTKSDERRAC